MLIIVNPYATTVSDRLKHLVVYALRGRYLVDAVDTERRDHATELCREAAREGYDVVVAFGGDGTVNEAANGLAGSGMPLSCLPGGRANVYCRMLGIPSDVVDATEHLLAHRRRLAARGRSTSGCVDERFFLFSAGVGLDASVVAQVDAHPRLKARGGEYYYAWSCERTYTAPLPASRPPRLEAQLGDETVNGVTRDRPERRPVHLLRRSAGRDRRGRRRSTAAISPGSSCSAANPLDIPTIMWRALSRTGR